jgi:SAM-dependent methyltransferase
MSSSGFNRYYDKSYVESGVAEGRHRQLVGGRWDEIGALQLELLTQYGLKPDHTLLDVGCGCLRGGVHFVRYLDPGRYFGTDINQSLLDAGYDVELAQAGLQDRLPRTSLRSDDAFDFTGFGVQFDRAIAFSLFTHLPLNAIRICLERMADVVKPGGIFHATFFELPEGEPSGKDIRHPPADVLTHGAADPYHHRVADFRHAVEGLPWEVRYVGETKHPRGQRLVNFVRRALPGEAAVAGETRTLSVGDAKSLHAGSSHYRSFVGPPGRFDFMSGTQFALLFHLGLRDHHHVLDFGCGSLRLGRLLIPFLQPDRYFGIDPNRWLIEDGIARELGYSAVTLKRPRFDTNSDFDCGVFERRFDFVVAQSIVTHAGADLAAKLLASAARSLEQSGLILFNYIRGGDRQDAPGGWHYPRCIEYAPSAMAAMLKRAGLSATPLPWFHPRASWIAAALSPAALPDTKHLTHLSGAVLRSEQFADSLTYLDRKALPD